MPLSPASSSPSSPAAPAAGGAAFTAGREGDGARFVFSGTLTVHTLARIEGAVRSAVSEARGRVVFDLTGLDSLDTSGALLINTTFEALRRKGVACEPGEQTRQQEELLAKSVLPERERAPEQSAAPAVLLLNNLGRRVIAELEGVGQLIGFFGQFLVTLWGLLLRPRAMRWTSLVFHMEQVGLRAVPIVALLTFLIGLVVAYMGAQQLATFGADVFAVNLLEVTVMREMGVLITAIVVAGRSSSSFTAQIGAMVANEEVDALRSMGLNVSALLVAPRVLALALCLPMLVFLADMMAMLGGAVAIWFTIDMNFAAFLTQLQDVAQAENFFVGMIKTPFFAVAIGIVGCFQGFRATSSAESVGFLTTISVVQSIFIVILLDALFAIFFSTVGI